MSAGETVRAHGLDAASYAAATATVADPVRTSGWVDVAVRGGLVGSRGESWLEVSAVRDGVSA